MDDVLDDLGRAFCQCRIDQRLCEPDGNNLCRLARGIIGFLAFVRTGGDDVGGTFAFGDLVGECGVVWAVDEEAEDSEVASLERDLYREEITFGWIGACGAEEGHECAVTGEDGAGEWVSAVGVGGRAVVRNEVGEEGRDWGGEVCGCWAGAEYSFGKGRALEGAYWRVVAEAEPRCWGLCVGCLFGCPYAFDGTQDLEVADAAFQRTREESSIAMRCVVFIDEPVCGAGRCRA